MQRTGNLRVETEPDRLAMATLANLQGEWLPAQRTRTVEPLRDALDVALEHLRTYAV